MKNRNFQLIFIIYLNSINFILIIISYYLIYYILKYHQFMLILMIMSILIVKIMHFYQYYSHSLMMNHPMPILFNNYFHQVHSFLTKFYLFYINLQYKRQFFSYLIFYHFKNLLYNLITIYILK